MTRARDETEELETALARRGSLLLRKIEVQRQIKLINARKRKETDKSRIIKNQLYSLLGNLTFELNKATLEVERLTENGCEGLIDPPADSIVIAEALRYGVREDQLEMLWSADDPSGDIRIHFCDPDLDNPGFGLIILDHNWQVSLSLKSQSREGSAIHFKHYLKYQLAHDPRQAWMTDKFDRVIEAQYLKYVKPLPTSSIVETPTKKPNKLRRMKNFLISMWSPITD